MTVDLGRRMRCYRGRVMHVVRLCDPPMPWRAKSYMPWYESACQTSGLYSGELHPRVSQPCYLWSVRRVTVRRHAGLVITRTFHDCQECTLAVQQ